MTVQSLPRIVRPLSPVWFPALSTGHKVYCNYAGFTTPRKMGVGSNSPTLLSPTYSTRIVVVKNLVFDSSQKVVPKPTGTAYFSGVVKNNGSAVAGAKVGVYYRKSMELIERTLTKADGTFSFTGYSPNSNDYFVLALDPNESTTYNAMVFDRVRPT